MQLKNLLAVLILTSMFLVFVVVFRSMGQPSKNKPTEALSIDKSEEVQDVSGFFDKAKDEIEETFKPRPGDKPKCNIGGNLVDEGTVVDGVTCVSD